MLYIIWAIIFVAAFLYFVYVVIIGGTLVKQKLGVIAAVVFVGGLLSFAGNSNHNSKNQQTTQINGIEKWTFANEDTLEKGILLVNWISVDSNIFNKYRFMYTCGLEKQTHKYIAVSANVTTIGWQLEQHWTLTALSYKLQVITNTLNIILMVR